MERHNYLLFGIQKDGSRLFDSQLDLVRELINTDTFQGKTEESIKVLVSNILGGKRRPSKNFQKGLKTILLQKNGINESHNIYLDIMTSLGSNNDENGERDATDLEQLIALQNSSSKIYITTPEPSELQSHRDADMLKRDLLERIGVLDSDLPKAQYTFYFPKSNNLYEGSIGSRFWTALYDYCRYVLRLDNVDEKLYKINKGDDCYLKVFDVDESLAWLPVVVLDPNLTNNNPVSSETAFIVTNFLTKEQERRISVAKFAGTPSYFYWRKNCFMKLQELQKNKNSSESLFFQELKFEQIKPILQKNKLF